MTTPEESRRRGAKKSVAKRYRFEHNGASYSCITEWSEIHGLEVKWVRARRLRGDTFEEIIEMGGPIQGRGKRKKRLPLPTTFRGWGGL